jgi:ADP-heptose:LPS heptosyltransferase
VRSFLAKLQAVGKAFLLGLLRLLFARRGKGGPIDPAAIHSVLVVRTDDRVGNLLLTTPLLAALREALPKARIGLLCAARLASAVEGTGLYDDLWAFEKRDFFRRPWRFVAFCLRLRRARYDVAIEAGHWHAFSFTAGMLTVWNGAPIRIGHRRGEADRLLTHALEKDAAVAYDAAAKIELLRPLGISRLDCPPLQTALGRGEAPRFAELFGGRPVLLVNPGGRKADHRWSPALFAQAVNEIRKGRELPVFVAWGPGEEALALDLLKRVDGAALLPPTNLAELAGTLRSCALFLTNDTGPMHLAVAVGAQTVAIFLGEDWPRWAAPGPTFRAVPIGGLEAAAQVESVAAAARELLGRPRQTRRA